MWSQRFTRTCAWRLTQWSTTFNCAIKNGRNLGRANKILLWHTYLSHPIKSIHHRKGWFIFAISYRTIFCIIKSHLQKRYSNNHLFWCKCISIQSTLQYRIFPNALTFFSSRFPRFVTSNQMRALASFAYIGTGLPPFFLISIVNKKRKNCFTIEMHLRFFFCFL